MITMNARFAENSSLRSSFLGRRGKKNIEITEVAINIHNERLNNSHAILSAPEYTRGLHYSRDTTEAMKMTAIVFNSIAQTD